MVGKQSKNNYNLKNNEIIPNPKSRKTLFEWYIRGTYMKHLLKILLNKAISDCSFANLSSNFTIFRILASNDTVDMSHDIACHGNHFDRKLCITMVTKLGIILNCQLWAECKVYITG